MFKQTLYVDLLVLVANKSGMDFCTENPAFDWKTEKLEVRTGGFFYLDTDWVPAAVQLHFKKGYKWTCFSLQQDLYLASLVNSALVTMQKSNKISREKSEDMVKQFLTDEDHSRLWYQLIRFCERRQD